MHFNERQLLLLRGVVVRTIEKLKKNNADEQKCTSILTFMSSKIRGSKRYRKILVGKSEEKITANIQKHADNTETISNYQTLQKLNALWNTSYLDNSTRIFFFNFIITR